MLSYDWDELNSLCSRICLRVDLLALTVSASDVLRGPVLKVPVLFFCFCLLLQLTLHTLPRTVIVS